MDLFYLYLLFYLTKNYLNFLFIELIVIFLILTILFQMEKHKMEFYNIYIY